MTIEQTLRGMTAEQAHAHMVKKIVAKIRKRHGEHESCKINYDGDRQAFGRYMAMFPNLEDGGKTLVPRVSSAVIDCVWVNGDSIIMGMTDKGIVLPCDASVENLISIYRHVIV